MLVFRGVLKISKFVFNVVYKMDGGFITIKSIWLISSLLTVKKSAFKNVLFVFKIVCKSSFISHVNTLLAAYSFK